MDEQAFIREIERAGYVDIAPRDYPPHHKPAEHTHDFAVAGLVVAGEFGLACGDKVDWYKAGERFTLPKGDRHAEFSGAEGARAIIGCKY